MKRVLFVGLSDKPDREPLDSRTQTGKIIDAISDLIPGVMAYRTNLVDRAPIDDKGRLRYPTKEEIEECIPHLEKTVAEISPDIIVSLGKTTEASLSKRFENHISISHPSYIAVYKKKFSEEYIRSSAEKIISELEQKK
ncbi:MAG: uracil-DNA glycosylase family protein [Candidatus Colwellbacteria bacterium]|nr:uracil-DNA glycosylase family protein [Candidatus Colwellbacteria bacterium]